MGDIWKQNISTETSEIEGKGTLGGIGSDLILKSIE